MHALLLTLLSLSWLQIGLGLFAGSVLSSSSYLSFWHGLMHALGCRHSMHDRVFRTWCSCHAADQCIPEILSSQLHVTWPNVDTMSSRGDTSQRICADWMADAAMQVRKQKWDSYSKGEELFGLPVTKYEGLEQTETEIQMLDRLYSYAFLSPHRFPCQHVMHRMFCRTCCKKQTLLQPAVSRAACRSHSTHLYICPS